MSPARPAESPSDLLPDEVAPADEAAAAETEATEAAEPVVTAVAAEAARELVAAAAAEVEYPGVFHIDESLVRRRSKVRGSGKAETKERGTIDANSLGVRGQGGRDRDGLSSTRAGLRL